MRANTLLAVVQSDTGPWQLNLDLTIKAVTAVLAIVGALITVRRHFSDNLKEKAAQRTERERERAVREHAQQLQEQESRWRRARVTLDLGKYFDSDPAIRDTKLRLSDRSTLGEIEPICKRRVDDQSLTSSEARILLDLDRLLESLSRVAFLIEGGVLELRDARPFGWPLELLLDDAYPGLRKYTEYWFREVVDLATRLPDWRTIERDVTASGPGISSIAAP
jgi:hypothetical protein